MEANRSQSQSSREEEAENLRYRHLFEPISDVCANWDMNIKEYLDDYLEKLKRDKVRTVIREDGEKFRFNFAEAAKILQSSLKIYCLKVDFLYDAISEAYMGISNIKKKKNRNDGDQSTSERNSGRINADFDLLDEKAEMLEHRIDTKWLLEQNQQRAKLGPLKVGNCREEGRRDRFVNLPISFIPSKKSAPSLHHFCYKQNKEKIYIPQSDLFSFNSIAIASPGGENMTTFMNIAYLQTVHDFSADYIPYLRDENNRRLHHIGHPYDIDAPAEVYNCLLELDEREDRQNESHEFLATLGGDHERFDTLSIADESDLFRTPHGLRASFVEAPRASSAPSFTVPIAPRRSGLFDLVRPGSQLNPLFSGNEGPLNGSLLFGSPMIGARRPDFAEPQINVDDELAYQDQYADVKPRLRKKPDVKKKKSLVCRPAEELCKVRNDKVRANFTKRGKDYDAHKRNVFEYINARVFSSTLCKTGSILDSINPRMRKRTVQSLNRVFYAQEKYEKSIRTQRRRLEADREKARVKEKQRAERELRRRDDLAALQLNQEPEMLESVEPRPQPILAQVPANDARDKEAFDNFGIEPEPGFNFEADNYVPDDDYNPAVQLAQEIGDFGDGFLNVDDFALEPDTPLDVNPFNSTLPDDSFVGDTTLLTRTTFEFGTFATNDPAFFEMDKLAEFFANSQLDFLTDDGILLQAIRSFWSESNQQSQENLRNRLRNWSAHIFERLDDDARHKPFEIHVYGTTILDRFGSEIGKILRFKEIVKGVPKYEISRYLLALLILANCGNVEIISDDRNVVNQGLSVIKSRTMIKLLSTDRHHEIFQSEQLLVTG